MIRVGNNWQHRIGKDFISKLFKCPVFNADNEVKYLYKYNKECFKKLKKTTKIYKIFSNKKKELINSISSDSKNLKKISSVVHPMVRKRMNVFLKK